MSLVALVWIKAKGCVPVFGLTGASVERVGEACAVRELRLVVDGMEFLEEMCGEGSCLDMDKIYVEGRGEERISIGNG